jgi:hypothetical protein
VAVATTVAIMIGAGAAGGAKFRTTIHSGGARWATVRNAPGAYVIGDARDGTAVTLERSGSRGRWWLGSAGKPVGHCGWVLGAELPDLATDRHRHPVGGRPGCHSLRAREFSDGVKNSAPHNDGAKARLVTGPGCDSKQLAAYGNVSPWESRSQPRDRFRPLGDGVRVLWRYVSRDRKWVMVRDPDWSPALGGTNWFFVRTRCLANAQKQGCFGRSRCKRRLPYRNVSAFFGTPPSTDPYISIQRAYNGEYVNLNAEASCRGDLVPRSMDHVPISKDGSYHGRDEEGTTLDGRFQGDVAVGSFRLLNFGCDTGEIPFTVPRIG